MTRGGELFDWASIVQWGGWVALAVAVIPALLVYRRAGETARIAGRTADVAAEDAATRQFAAISDANERLREALLQRMDDLATENITLGAKFEQLANVVIPELQAKNATCLEEGAKMREELQALRRFVEHPPTLDPSL